jgi:sulfur-carrier protein adenylyltransferase/sulfurtransferase
MLSTINKEIYNRHLLIPDFTEADQEKIVNARILVIGAGGLGSPVLIYLTAAGVSNIGIVDYDKVAIHNLHRQVLYNFDDIGKNKAVLAAKKLKSQNPYSNPIIFNTKWTSANAKDIASGYDMIIDCSDNSDSRFLSDSISQQLQIPFIFGAVNNWEGQVSVFNYRKSASYKDIIAVSENNLLQSQTNGIIGVVPAVAGSIMVAEALKIITGKGETLEDKLLHFSLFRNVWKVFNL